MSPLSPHHRRSLFTSLSPIVGEEEADALLDQLPRTEEEAPASQADLQALDLSLRSEMATGFADVGTEIAELRGELHAGLAEVRGELHAGLAEVRGETTDGFAQLRTEMSRGFNELRTEITATLVRNLRWTAWALFAGLSLGLALMALIARTQV